LRENESDIINPSLIIFIDELDRCRPDFSLGIFEILKHFFNIDGIHFILVGSKSYLELAVDGRYGHGVSSSEYLEKFYDFIVLFDTAHDLQVPGNVSPFIKKTLDGLISASDRESNGFKDIVTKFSLSYRLTLRQIENFCINASLGYLAVKDLSLYKPGILVAFAALLKSLNIELYKKLRDGSIKWAEVREFISEGQWYGAYEDGLDRILRWHIDQSIDVNDPEWAKYHSSLWHYNLEREKAMSFICNNVVDRFSSKT
jgi:hypothetical protein